MNKLLLLLLAITFSFSTFGRSAFKIVGNDVLIDLDGFGVKSNSLKVEVWTESTVKIVYSMDEEIIDQTQYFGIRPEGEVDFKAAYAQANVEITTSNIIVNVAEDGLVRIMNRNGRKLMVESDRSFKALEESGKYEVSQKFYLNRGEHIYGFGQQDLANRYNLREKKFEIKQSKDATASPIFFSERGYAFIWNNFSPSTFEDTPGGLIINSAIAKNIEFFVVNGPTWPEILKEIRHITGQAPLLPEWAFGFSLNPEAYASEAELNAAIQKYKELNIPVETTTADYNIYNQEKAIINQPSNDELNNIKAYTELKDAIAQPSTSRKAIATHCNIPGIQQYGTFLAPQQVSSCWESLKNQVSAGIVTGLSGQPYWTTKVGGNFDNSSCNATEMNELMTRWFQFAAFTPVFQGASNGMEIWECGPADSDTYMGINKAINLRYRMMPYIYTSAYIAASEGSNLVQSLLFNYQEDEKVQDINTQYLFGNSLMVCPVVSSGAKTASVYLPVGNEWVDFWTGKSYEAGKTIEQNLTLEHLPLFVKKGTILPLAAEQKEENSSAMEIRIYPGADASFTLYEDDGTSLEYNTEKYTKISFEYSEKKKTLQIGSIEGGYDDMLIDRIFNVVVVSENAGTGCSFAEESIAVEYSGKKEKVKLE